MDDLVLALTLKLAKYMTCPIYLCPKAGLLSLGSTDILDHIILCPLRIFSSISVPSGLDSIRSVFPSCGNQRYLQIWPNVPWGQKSSPAESYWSRAVFTLLISVVTIMIIFHNEIRYLKCSLNCKVVFKNFFSLPTVIPIPASLMMVYMLHKRHPAYCCSPAVGPS